MWTNIPSMLISILWRPNYSANGEITITLPHSGKSVKLTKVEDQSNYKYSSVLYEKRDSDGYVRYSGFGGAGVGRHETINYSSKALAYDFSLDQYSMTKAKYWCKQGDCSWFTLQKLLPLVEAEGPGDFGKRMPLNMSVCFPNGTYYSYYRTNSSENESEVEGAGCPN